MVRFTGFIAGMMVVLFASHALAVPIAEIGDAGETMTTAQIAGAGTTQMNGSIRGDADLFLFAWSGGAFGASTNGSTFDTQLFLFDALGVGVWGNDDGGPGLLSLITDPNLAAGNYYIGISAYNYDPRDAGGNRIFPSFPFNPQLGPFDGDSLDQWAGYTGYGGSYSINFRYATTAVPEPGTLLLLGAGLLGLGFSRKYNARGNSRSSC